MLKPKELQNLPKGLTDIYSELSEFVLRDIARRIAKAAEITDTAEYQLYRARALGLSTKVITQKIAKINGVAETEIEKIIREAAERSDEFDRKMLGADGGAAVPLSENEQLQIFMAGEIDNTFGLCRNYTGTLGFAEVNAQGQVIYSSMTDFLRKQMDMAHMKVASGATDYNTAIRQACRALSDSGLRTVYYESGRSDRIEVAVRRALMTSVSQITQRISEQNAEEFGADGWEISAHSGARPSHAVYQGRQFPNSKYELIVRPLIEDYNCRHSAFPIIMGVSQPAYTEEELKNIDPPPFTYEGRTYTAYQAQQQMRKMERSMRKQKDRCIVADAAGDKDTFTAASIKLRRQKDIYEDFCKAAGTYTEYERTFVQGYDRHLAAKTGAITRAQNKFKNAQVTLNQSPPLTNGGKGGIIDEKKFHVFQSGNEVNDFFYYDDEKRGLLARRNSSYGKWEAGLTTDQKQAVSDYTAGGYDDINSYLRRKNGWEQMDQQAMEAFKADLQAVTTNFELKEPIKVYRYSGIEAIGSKELEKLVGTEYSDPGFMSASPAKEGIENAVITDRDILFEILVPSGKGHGAYINNLSSWKDEEYEFLLTCGSKFDVISVDTSDSVPIIRMVAK